MICCVSTAVVQCMSSVGGSPIIAALSTPPVRGASWASVGATPPSTINARTASGRVIMRTLREGLPRQPGVPEVELGRRLEAADFLARHVQEEVVAELDAADILVEDLLDALDERLALLGIALALEVGEHLLLLLRAPPPGPVALERGRQRGIGVERVTGREHVEQLGLVAPLDERRPVQHLQIDLEPDLLHLLLRHQRGLVHPVVFASGDPPDRLAG